MHPVKTDTHVIELLNFVRDRIWTISGSVRNTATLLEVLVATKIALLADCCLADLIVDRSRTLKNWSFWHSLGTQTSSYSCVNEGKFAQPPPGVGKQGRRRHGR